MASPEAEALAGLHLIRATMRALADKQPPGSLAVCGPSGVPPKSGGLWRINSVMPLAVESRAAARQVRERPLMGRRQRFR